MYGKSFIPNFSIKNVVRCAVACCITTQISIFARCASTKYLTMRVVRDMKQALILIEEINRKRKAVQETKSQYLKNDYSKRIRADMFELKDYCKYRGLKFKELTRFIK